MGNLKALRFVSESSLPVICASKASGHLLPVTARQQCSSAGACGSRSEGSLSNAAARRRVLLWLPASVGVGLLQNESVQANVLEDFTRKTMRPDVDYTQALIMLLDARGVLREIEVWFLELMDQLLIVQGCLKDGCRQSIRQR